MVSPKRNIDRRVQRTQLALQQAFKEVVQEKGYSAASIGGIEKGFLAASIQDITERANVNRGTFYLHFADKYMLAEAVIRAQFHQMIADALPPVPQWNAKTLYLLIQVMLDSFEHKYHHQPHSSLVLVPLLERVTHEELTALLLTWLKQKRSNESNCAPIQPETLARIVGWTIFGSAIQWSQEENAIPRDKMAEAILQIITEGTP